MTVSQLTYALQKGYVHHWLAAGPQVVPAENVDDKNTHELPVRDFPAQVYPKYHQADPGITKDPVECGPLEEAKFTVGDYEGAWKYVRCAEDHFIDQSARYPQPVYLRSWAFTELVADRAQEVRLVLTSSGPADVWLNGQPVHHHAEFHAPEPGTVEFSVTLAAGINKVLVQFENACFGACPNLLALQVRPANGIHVEIPTLIEQLERRNELEESFETIYLARDVFTRDHTIQARWPEELQKGVYSDARIEAPGGLTYAHAEVNGEPGDTLSFMFASMINTGPYRAHLMPRGFEYYEKNLRISKFLPFWVINDNIFSTAPYGSFLERRLEALQHAIRFDGNLYAETARMALGMWKQVELKTIEAAIEQVKGRAAGSIEALIGLLRMAFSFGRRPEFPKKIKHALKDCLLSYPYRLDQASCEEDEQILFHAAEILAGQRYSDLTFADGQTGIAHREQGEKQVLEWIHARASVGFSHWNSDAAYAKALTALSLLVDYADDEEVAEMATILMDKIFYALALNSFRGVLASSSGQTSSGALRGGYLQETSGATRVMWGQGIFNQYLAAPVSLACSKEYELPLLLLDIAHATPEGLWSRETHQVNTTGGLRAAHLSTFRTPDAMLSSAQDYYPGQPGGSEHIWQATLGPGATVFVNHPANASLSDALPSSYWLGNRTLPRAGQWKDTLIAAYALPADDWMGFTHAYFPTFAFDEYVLRDGWAFARKDNAFLALTASTGIQMVTQGREALRELRSPGPNTIWVCQVGRALQDQSFTEFQERVLAKKVEFKNRTVEMETIRGEALRFGWEGPFTVDGEELTLKSDRHYESLFGVADFPASQMDIQYGDRLLRLDFSTGEGGDAD